MNLNIIFALPIYKESYFKRKINLNKLFHIYLLIIETILNLDIFYIILYLFLYNITFISYIKLYY